MAGKRVTPEKIAALQSNNPDLSEQDARRILRGHGKTGEHGVDRPVALGNGQVAITFRQERFADRAMRQAEKIAGDGGRVKIVLKDKSGNVRELYTNRDHSAGITAEELARRVRESGVARVVDEALRGRYVDRHGIPHEVDPRAGGFDPDRIAEYQIISQ